MPHVPDEIPEKQSTPSTVPHIQNPADQDDTSRHNRKVCLIMTVVIVAILLALGGTGVWYFRHKLFSSDTADPTPSSTPPGSASAVSVMDASTTAASGTAKAATSASNASMTALSTSTGRIGHSNSTATASASASSSTTTTLAISASRFYDLSRDVTNSSAFPRLNPWTDITEDQTRPYIFMEMATTYRYGLLIVGVPKIPWGCGAWV
ncbi:hypothetical protein JCM21900_004781 [Sporobolomyces salmonicolor]